MRILVSSNRRKSKCPVMAMCRRAGLQARHFMPSIYWTFPNTSALSYQASYGDDIDFAAIAALRLLRIGDSEDYHALFADSNHYRRLRAIAARTDRFLDTYRPDAVILKPFTPVCQIILCKALQKKIPALIWKDAIVSGGAFLLDHQAPHFIPKVNSADQAWQRDNEEALPTADREKAAAFLHSWRESRTSKYHQRESASDLRRLQHFLRRDTRPTAFLALQTPFDASVMLHLPTAFGVNYWQWVETTMDSIPDDWKLIIKTHPRALHHDLPEQKNCLSVERVSIHRLFAEANCTITMSSNVGMEAALSGHPAIVTGRPIYAGKGITIDLDPGLDLHGTLPAALQSALSFTPASAALERFVSRILLDYHLWPGETRKLLDRIQLAREQQPAVVDPRRPFFDYLPKPLKRWPDAVHALDSLGAARPNATEMALWLRYLIRQIRKKTMRAGNAFSAALYRYRQRLK